MITRKRCACHRPTTNLETRRTQNNESKVTTMDTSSSLDSSEFSLETFTSDNSLPFDANSWGDVRRKLRSIAWIQCDNQNCMKWRKIPKENLENISESDKWFCHQNSDLDFNSCSVPEEDVHLYDQLADRSGLKYLKSQLVPGTLVWAKMDGYCSWPAVVTPEPGTDGGHLHRNEGDEIDFYHVEFLGQPHSHGWVCSRHVTAFTVSSVGKQRLTANEEKINRGRPRKGYHRRHKTLCTPPAQKLKTSYKSVSVQHGVDEAMKMLPLSPGKRLNRCTYVQSSQVTQHGSETQQARISKLLTPTDGKSDVPGPGFTSFHSALENRTKEERLMLDVEMYKRNERAFEHDVTRFMIRNGLKTSKGPFWQNQRISLFQLFLAVHERGGYVQVTCRKRWPAVYREVTETPCQTDVINSRGAKLFYYRHLYPYELYIHGDDFQKVVAEAKQRDICMASDTNEIPVQSKQQPKKKRVSTQKKVEKQHHSSTTVDNRKETDEDIASDSLREMLQVLEENSRLGLEDAQQENEIDITFYDDSTPSRGKLLPLADFEPPATPELMTINNNSIMEEGTSPNCQQVLQNMENVAQAATEEDRQCEQHSKHNSQVVPSAPDRDDTIYINSGSDSVFSQQLLEKLEALQDGISFIDHQMI